MNGLFLFCKYRCRLALKTQSSDTDQEHRDQSNTSYMKLQDKTCCLWPWSDLGCPYRHICSLVVTWTLNLQSLLTFMLKTEI